MEWCVLVVKNRSPSLTDPRPSPSPHLTSTGSTTHSAISAVLAANAVLIGYVVVAFKEDDGGPSVKKTN
jgi:hypothetical protein